jgi:hypothetical protein
MLGDRYRVVALLGSGGMGEVYRADDIKLGQPVALKFLPQAAGQDPMRRERLYGEVRLGRQVSHPNVCRLYDIGEWEGNHFLAMEYVDGEDLASLLRRIGKLPPEKALDIAREICAGIAAAHGLGIIHRDLKPANIMIDGRGQARITDFGLAVVAEDLAARNEIAGTPAYMAPEQLAGGTVTHKSDLYALGLILFEIFTGRKLFEGAAATDPSSRRSTLRSLSASGQSAELAPAIQRVIARCVEENPDARPASIHAVIAALPGGDPLQAALDAGETPSPQMIAAAGEVGELQPSVAWGILAVSILGLIAVLLLFPRTMLFRMVPLPKPPEALNETARSILAAAGYPETPYDSDSMLTTDDDFFEMVKSDPSPTKWDDIGKMRPGVMYFRYRDSSGLLVASNREGRITDHDPPMTQLGTRRVDLDAHGRLILFLAVPPQQVSPTPAAPRSVDWSKFFAFAGGDIDGLRPVPSSWTAPVESDEKRAWEGFYRGAPERKVRIEAASLRGKPVWFRIIGSWARPTQTDVRPPGGPGLAFDIITGILLVLAIFLARRNLRRGRGDWRTARRLAVVVFLIMAAGNLLRADHVSDAGQERFIIERAVAWALFFAAQVCVLYLALEPYVRRRWPRTLIGWTRLFAGRVRDPMIGRDLAVGTCAGILLELMFMAAVHAPAWFGHAPLAPIARWASPLLSLRHVLFTWAMFASEGIIAGLTVLLMLFVALLILRKRWAAVGAVWLFATFVGFSPDEFWPVELPVAMIASTVVLFLMLRFGVLTVAISFAAMSILEASPLTLDPDAWYFGRSMVSLLFYATLIGYGFWASLGEKSAFAVPLLDEA